MKAQSYMQCTTADQLFEAIAAAVRMGLTFRADYDLLTIVYTGGC